MEAFPKANRTNRTKTWNAVLGSTELGIRTQHQDFLPSDQPWYQLFQPAPQSLVHSTWLHKSLGGGTWDDHLTPTDSYLSNSPLCTSRAASIRAVTAKSHKFGWPWCAFPNVQGSQSCSENSTMSSCAKNSGEEVGKKGDKGIHGAQN